MTQQTNTCCSCEPVKTVLLPLTGLGVDASALGDLGGGLSREEVAQMIKEALQGAGVSRQWQSDWFNIANNSAYIIQHNLGLQSPDKCDVRLVVRVKTSQAGWEAGDIVFGDGGNYLGGAYPNEEGGWAISLGENSANVSFGTTSGYIFNRKQGGHGVLFKSNVECRLVIDY